MPADQVQRLEAILAEFSPWLLTPVQLAALARIEMTPPQIENMVRALRRKGVADWDGERLASAGSASAQSFYPAMDQAAYRRRWGRVLGVRGTLLLDVLAKSGAEGLTWPEWLDRAAYNPKGNGSLARTQLLTLGFVAQQGSRYTLSDAWPKAAVTIGQPLLKIS